MMLHDYAAANDEKLVLLVLQDAGVDMTRLAMRH